MSSIKIKDLPIIEVSAVGDIFLIPPYVTMIPNTYLDGIVGGEDTKLIVECPYCDSKNSFDDKNKCVNCGAPM